MNENPVAPDALFPDDTIAAVRDLLALVIGALEAPSCARPAGFDPGAARVLAMADAALAYEAEHRRPWAREGGQ